MLLGYHGMRELTHASLFQDGDSAFHVSKVERVLETRHLVSSLDRDTVHHAQFLLVTSDKVKEGQLVKVLGLLVGQLDDLIIFRFSYSRCLCQGKGYVLDGCPASRPVLRDASKRLACLVP